MVRMKVKVEKVIFEHFEKILRYEPNVNYRFDKRITSYAHNFNITEVDPFGNQFSYWLGYDHNATRSSSPASYLVIEYNPSKCVSTGLLEQILFTFFKYEGVIVASLDIAMDFQVNINSLVIDKGRKGFYQLMDYGSDNKTHYIGKGDGSVKIYNKAREAGLQGDLTRYEIRKKIDEPIKNLVSSSYKLDYSILPVFYMQSIDVGDKTLSAVVYAVMNGYPMSSLSRDYKKKVRDVLLADCSINFDIEEISHTIRQWFIGYRDVYIYNSSSLG